MSALVYHERQDAGLCGVHCLNTLLQGPYFTEVDLMTLAVELDKNEKRLMAEMGTETTDYLKFMAEDSGNVADDGNYSIQVLSEALKVWNLTVHAFGSPEMSDVKKNPQAEEAFICNLSSHWLTIRRIDNYWFDLNSVRKVPNHLSPLYLGLFLDTLQQSGYTVYIVRGDFPIPNTSILSNDGRWVRVNLNESAGKRKIEETEDPELAFAIAASLNETNADSLNSESPIPIAVEEDEVDPELAEAIRLSQEPLTLEPEPPASADTTHLAFRLPNGNRIMRRFLKTQTIKDVFLFLASEKISFEKHLLRTAVPRLIFDDPEQSLIEAGLFPTATLLIEETQIK